MSRRPVLPSRRSGDGGGNPFAGSSHHKSQTSPLLSLGLVIVGGFLLISYSYSGSGVSTSKKEALANEGISCTAEVQKVIPILRSTYGDSMNNILHVGVDTCSVVSKLVKEERIEAWGIEPYDLEDASSSCKRLVQKGRVRVADIKFPLPYKSRSFPLVIVSDSLDYLTPKYLNKTIPELARVSMDGVVIFSGHPAQKKSVVADLPKFGRPAKLRSPTWWIEFFLQNGLEENDDATKKFNQALSPGYKTSCQVFHLKAY